MATVNVLNIYIVYKCIAWFAHSQWNPCNQFYGSIKMSMFCLFHAMHIEGALRTAYVCMFMIKTLKLLFPYLFQNKFQTSLNRVPALCFCCFVFFYIVSYFVCVFFPFSSRTYEVRFSFFYRWLLLMHDKCVGVKEKTDVKMPLLIYITLRSACAFL